MAAIGFTDFVTGLGADAIPENVRAVLWRSFIDTMGVAAVGAGTEISAITRTLANRFWRAAPEAGEARMLFDGRAVSPAGAAFAGAFTIDSIDAHDGNTAAKGHAGSAVFPGVLAFADAARSGKRGLTGGDLLVALAIGYEIAYRSGLAQHGTVSDYHTSGSWTAVGVAAAGARLLGLTAEPLRHAAGIAEYHGPRSQMMRGIDFPTMLRDGVGWGAPSGVMAAQMAELGFTGASAITIEGEAARPWWHDLGERWEILETHYKRYPVCRWAHPAIDAARDLMDAHQLTSAQIQRVRIRTFHYACRLAGHSPKSQDEMIYAMVFPVATMIARGVIGIDELRPEILGDPEIRRIAEATDVVETEHYTKISTRKRWADVTLYLQDGRALESEPRTPKGDPDDPLSDAEIAEKFHRFADPSLGPARATEIEALAEGFDGLSADHLNRLLDAVLSPLCHTPGSAA